MLSEIHLTEEQMEYLKLFVAIVLASLGWVIAHYFTARRDVSTKRRELVINHLIDTYKILTCEISHSPATAERMKLIESMVADIQLFGSAQQIQLAQELIEQLTKGQDFDLDPLINSLRNDLRTSLGLSKAQGNVHWVRGPE